MSELPKYGHWIAGREEAPSGGGYLASDNPFTGKDWYEFARGNAQDVDRAVAAAKTAQRAWAALGGGARGRIMIAVADAIERESGRLAELEVKDNGKLLVEMRTLGAGVAAWFRYYAGIADKIEGAVIPTDLSRLTFTRYDPLGVIGMITPWNSPLYLLANKLGPALAAGNAAVIKPSEFTSVSTLALVKLCETAGLPAGVLNVVTGLGGEAGAAIVEHPDIAKICFTGSETGGQIIYEGAARGLKGVTLELGGKSPNIVFEDADIEAAVMGAVGGIFAAAGQTCIAGSRLLLQSGIHDRFVERLKEVAGAAKLGDPMDPATNIGPIATSPQFDKVLSYLDIARQDGATFALGGTPYELPGHDYNRFIPPTILTGVTNRMRIAREEVFGPVLSVIRFEDEAEALEIANDTPFGLAAGIWTSDIGRAIRLSSQLQAGTVWVNIYRTGSVSAPFGGYKRSGVGREGGVEAIKEFLEVKTTVINSNLDVANPFVTRT